MLKELRLPLLIIFIAALVGDVCLAFFPQWDIDFSNLFFIQGNFLGYQSPITNFFDVSVYVASVALATLMLFATRQVIKKEKKIGEGSKRLLFFVFVLFIGGVGIVQAAKFTVERPRPYSIVEFQGVAEFVPVFQMNDNGKGKVPNSDRSFPSGHTASSFSTVALSVIPKRKKSRISIFAAGVTFSTVAGLMRILEGNHYLSDVLGAIALVSFVMLLLDHYYSDIIDILNRYFIR